MWRSLPGHVDGQAVYKLAGFDVLIMLRTGLMAHTMMVAVVCLVCSTVHV